MIDPYTILGVPPGATQDECKNAFRALAKTCHPDLHPNDVKAEARFKDINAAYNAITNPQPAQQPPQSPHWHFNFTQGQSSPFDDLFAQMRGQRPHSVTTYEIRITLEDAFHGKETVIQVQQGRELKIRIPRGVEDGMRLLVQGQPNDSHILIRVLPHTRMTRNGPNLTTVIPVTAFDVLLENEIEVVGIDEHTMRVAIPRNFDSSRKLRLAGQGMADVNGSRGDLLVELFIQYPSLSADQLEALRLIAKENSTFISD
jgi:curved DNA-binding protein